MQRSACLHDLASHTPPVPKAYRSIAAHPHATGPTLLLCARDHAARPIAARHPAFPPAALLQLLDDPEDQVVEAAAANSALPRTAMADLLA